MTTLNLYTRERRADGAACLPACVHARGTLAECTEAMEPFCAPSTAVLQRSSVLFAGTGPPGPLSKAPFPRTLGVLVLGNEPKQGPGTGSAPRLVSFTHYMDPKKKESQPWALTAAQPIMEGTTTPLPRVSSPRFARSLMDHGMLQRHCVPISRNACRAAVPSAPFP